MYKYSEKDKQFLVERVDQFEKQLNRYLSGELDEDKFRSLRSFIVVFYPVTLKPVCTQPCLNAHTFTCTV